MSALQHDERGRFASKLTPELHDEIIRNLASGAPLVTAALAAGVARSTFHNWMAAGRQAAQAANGNLDEVLLADPHVRFLVEAERAQAQYVLDACTVITAIGQGKSKGRADALGWILERQYPSQFGKRARVEVTGQVTHQISIGLDNEHLARLESDEIRTLQALVRKMQGEVEAPEGLPLLEAGQA